MTNGPEPASGLPDSARRLVDTLTDQPPMTGKQLRDATGMPRRTLYTALRRLRELGLLVERASLHDTRQTYFWLRPDAVRA